MTSPAAVSEKIATEIDLNQPCLVPPQNWWTSDGKTLDLMSVYFLVRRCYENDNIHKKLIGEIDSLMRVQFIGDKEERLRIDLVKCFFISFEENQFSKAYMHAKKNCFKIVNQFKKDSVMHVCCSITKMLFERRDEDRDKLLELIFKLKGVYDGALPYLIADFSWIRWYSHREKIDALMTSNPNRESLYFNFIHAVELYEKAWCCKENPEKEKADALKIIEDLEVQGWMPASIRMMNLLKSDISDDHCIRLKKILDSADPWVSLELKAAACWYIARFYFDKCFNSSDDEENVFISNYNRAIGLRYLEKAIELGSSESIMYLGYFHERNIEVLKINKDIKKAYLFYEKGFNRYLESGVFFGFDGVNELINAYLNGNAEAGIEVDLVKAGRLLYFWSLSMNSGVHPIQSVGLNPWMVCQFYQLEEKAVEAGSEEVAYYCMLIKDLECFIRPLSIAKNDELSKHLDLRPLLESMGKDKILPYAIKMKTIDLLYEHLSGKCIEHYNSLSQESLEGLGETLMELAQDYLDNVFEEQHEAGSQNNNNNTNEDEALRMVNAQKALDLYRAVPEKSSYIFRAILEQINLLVHSYFNSTSGKTVEVYKALLADTSIQGLFDQFDAILKRWGDGGRELSEEQQSIAWGVIRIRADWAREAIIEPDI